MSRLNITARLLVIGIALLAIQNCKSNTSAAESQPPQRGEGLKTLPPGTDTVRPMTRDGVLQFVSRELSDSSGGSIDEYQSINPRGKGAPCPCCPDWLAMLMADPDSIDPGCCDPCFGHGFMGYVGPYNAAELGRDPENILSISRNVEFPGLIIAEVSVGLSRTPRAGGDSLDVTFGLMMANGSMKAEPSPEEKSWRLPQTEASYWLRFRREFRVQPGELTFTLTGRSQMEMGGDVAGARVIDVSYFPDFK